MAPIKLYHLALKITLEMYEKKLSKAHISLKDLLRVCDEKYLTFHHLLELKNHLEQMGIGLHERENNNYLLINIEITGLGRKLKLDITEKINIQNAESMLENYRAQQQTLNMDTSLHEQLKKLIRILENTAQQKALITPKVLMQSAECGLTHHRQVEGPLKLIKILCEYKNRIPLSLLVINQHTSLPAGMNESDIIKWETDLTQIYREVEDNESIDFSEDDVREIQALFKLGY